LPSGETLGSVSVASLAAVRFTGGLLPSAAAEKMSRLVEVGSIRPASRSVKKSVRPSALQAISSTPPNGLEGASPTRFGGDRRAGADRPPVGHSEGEYA
jgi:hypothetical protein